METTRQWCDNVGCPVFGRIGAANVRVFSYADRRFYCARCARTWSADKGTAFEGLHTSRLVVTRALAQLGERASLRATARLTHHPVNTVLDWLERGGRQAAAVSACLIQGLRVTYAQVDELWTFVKKTRTPVAA